MTVMTGLLSALTNAGFSGAATGLMYYLVARYLFGRVVSLGKTVVVALVVAAIVLLVNQHAGWNWL